MTQPDSLARRFFVRAARRARIIGPLLNYPRTQLKLAQPWDGFSQDDVNDINEIMVTKDAGLEELDQIIVFDEKNQRCDIFRIRHNFDLIDGKYRAEQMTIGINEIPDASGGTIFPEGIQVESPSKLVVEDTEKMYQILERAFRNDHDSLDDLAKKLIAWPIIEGEIDTGGLKWREEEDLRGNNPTQPERAPVPMDLDTFKELIGAWKDFEKLGKQEVALNAKAPSSFLEIFYVSDSDSEESSSLSY